MATPNISLLGATYSAVAGVTLPKQGGGTATFPWVEGSQTITTNGTVDVTNLAEVVVNVSGGGTPAISVVDTPDSHGGTIRTITALDISDSTLQTADQLAQGVTAYNKLGVLLTGTGGGGGGATQHTIHLEFSDSTDADIEVDYDDAWVGSLITSTEPTTYGQKTVDSAALDNVVWYTRPTEIWETVFNGTVTPVADTPYNYMWISSAQDVYFALGETWRITVEGNQYVTTARAEAGVAYDTVFIGNPKFSGGTDDGSWCPIDFFNPGYGALMGDTELSGGFTLKLEKRVSA